MSCLSLPFLLTELILLISDLLRNIRTQVLIKLIKPYTRIHIPFISKVRVLFDIVADINIVTVSFSKSIIFYKDS